MKDGEKRLRGAEPRRQEQLRLQLLEGREKFPPTFRGVLGDGPEGGGIIGRTMMVIRRARPPTCHNHALAAP